MGSTPSGHAIHRVVGPAFVPLDPGERDVQLLVARLAQRAVRDAVVHPERAGRLGNRGVPGVPPPGVRYRGAALPDDHPVRADSRVAPPCRVVVDDGDGRGRRRDRRDAEPHRVRIAAVTRGDTGPVLRPWYLISHLIESVRSPDRNRRRAWHSAEWLAPRDL